MTQDDKLKSLLILINFQWMVLLLCIEMLIARDEKFIIEKLVSLRLCGLHEEIIYRINGIFFWFQNFQGISDIILGGGRGIV